MRFRWAGSPCLGGVQLSELAGRRAVRRRNRVIWRRSCGRTRRSRAVQERSPGPRRLLDAANQGGGVDGHGARCGRRHRGGPSHPASGHRCALSSSVWDANARRRSKDRAIKCSRQTGSIRPTSSGPTWVSPAATPHSATEGGDCELGRCAQARSARSAGECAKPRARSSSAQVQPLIASRH